jgi:signal transduction histidine kinase/DNA-binding response OmpR family regulator
MLVDDDRDDYIITRDLFAELGGTYSLDWVSDYDAGLQELARGNHDVYLLDYRLGPRDGLELLREGLQAGCTAPIIIMTGQADRELDFAAMQAGAADYLVKGKIDSAGLERLLRYALQQKRNEIELEQRVRARTSELAQANGALQRWSEQLQDLARLSSRLNTAHDLSSVIDFVTQTVREIIGAHAALTRIVADAPDKPALLSVSWSDKLASWRNSSARFGTSELDQLVCGSNQSRRVTHQQLGVMPQFRASISDNSTVPPMRGWLAAPLISRDGINLGLIQLSDRYEDEFTENDEALLLQVAQTTSVALENARLYQDLRERDRRKDEFLAMLAHELRNPLAPIRNAVQILELTGTKDAHVISARDLIGRQVGHLVRLVDDLLDVSRITRGKINLVKEPVEVTKVVDMAVESCRPIIEERNHNLVIALPPQTVLVEADLTRLAQVIMNLLNNAAKYTDQGGRIQLGVEVEHGQVVFRVRDNGTGISQEMLPTIFDVFTQVDRTLDRSQGGLGLGLTLVRRLTEMHGGRVEAHSAGPGQGSEFIVRLPMADASEELSSEEHRSVELDGEPVAARGPRRRILIVDDNRDSAESLAMLLRVRGHEVRTAYDGRKSLGVAEEYRPDVVILDIGLPGLDGYTVARALRAQAAFRDALLVALTGYGAEEDRRACYRSGFDAHLVKPVDLVPLLGLLESQDATLRHEPDVVE